ncbi:MAG: hypothetical protein ACR2QG_08075 [Gammaproteobacteria bacterium]
MRITAIFLLCVVGLAACSGNGTADQNSSTPAEQGPAALAQSTVAQYAGVNYKEVQILSTEPVEFSDSSLGCPEPGMGYLQVITPGHIVIAEVDGQEGPQRFDVRVSGRLGKVCTNNGRPPISNTTNR